MPPKANGRTTSTINLKNAFIGKARKDDEKDNEKIPDPAADQPVADEDLHTAWREFAELRKNQIAEYNLLKREYILNGLVITITLSNPIEEPLLQNIRVQLIAHLRNKLNNNSLTVVTVLQTTEGKKIAYTPKEKFDLLIAKNPVLRDLKDRLGLDPEF